MDAKKVDAGPGHIPSPKADQPPQKAGSGSWNSLQVKAHEGQKHIPDKPGWITTRRRPISDHLISARNRKGIPLLRSLAKAYQRSEAAKVANELKAAVDSKDPEAVKKCLINLDHDLEMLGEDTVIKTRSYDARKLKWLRNEALFNYVELTLEKGKPSASELEALTKLLNTSIADNEADYRQKRDELSVGLEERMAMLYLDAAKEAEDPAEKRKQLADALISYRLLTNSGVKASHPKLDTGNLKEKLCVYSQQLMEAVGGDESLSLRDLLNHHKVISGAFSATKSPNPKYPEFIQQVVDRQIEESTEEEKSDAYQAARKLVSDAKTLHRNGEDDLKMLEQNYLELTMQHSRLLIKQGQRKEAKALMIEAAQASKLNPEICVEYITSFPDDDEAGGDGIEFDIWKVGSKVLANRI